MVVMVKPAPFANTPMSPSSSIYLSPRSRPLRSRPLSCSGLPCVAKPPRRFMLESSRTNLQSSATRRWSGVMAKGFTLHQLRVIVVVNPVQGAQKLRHAGRQLA